MYEGIDTTVLYEELAYQDLLPLRWQKLSADLPQVAANQYADRNVRVLQSCAALDEGTQLEKPDENAPHAADIQRLDMKMNLLLDLVGKLLASNDKRPTAVQVRFNALGAAWKESSQLIALGDEGILEIYLRDCLVDPLCLLGQVTGISNEGLIKIKFHPLGDAVADLIEKLTFQRHRRQVADARQPRAGDALRSFKSRR